MTQYIQTYQGFDFDLSTGMSNEDLLAKYNLTSSELLQAREFYVAGNTLEIERLLAAKAPAVPAEEVPPLEEIEIAPEKPEFGYRAFPRRNFLFVKPLPPSHKGRLLVPKAYESTSDMGFVHNVGDKVLDINRGDLVLFDKYAEVGNRFTLVDDDGELVDLIQMRDDNVTAVLVRVQL